MTEWWTAYDGNLLGSIGGSLLGVAGGIYGTLIGLLAHRGIGRRVLLPILVIMVALGMLSLLVGIVAAAMLHPHLVYLPLLLLCGIKTVVMGILIPIVMTR